MAPIQKTPLVAAPPRLFYGWYIVLVAFLGFFMSTGVSLYAFGVLIKPMSEDLGWSRSTLLAANTLATVTGALVSPWVGKLVDRHGTRFITALSAFMVGATFLPIGWVQSVWQFHLLYGVSNGMFRPGMSALSGPTAVANWFVRKRGRAMGWVATGVSMGGLLLVPLTQWIVGQWGWRTAWMALGLLTWVMMIAPALLILRRRPEDMGLLPDGDPPRPPQVRAGGAPAAAQEEPGWTAAAALRTRAFWLVLIAWSLSGMGTSSFFLLQTS
ncbi:MAG: MFS transporter, partial [Chloroflexi bacterium]|nr:MFS transporter [Chloroflexota bacterium]